MSQTEDTFYVSEKSAAFERHFVVLCSLLLFVSLITSISEVIQLFSGNAITEVRVTSGLRLLREGVYLVLFLDFVLCALSATNKPFVTRFSVLFFSLTIVIIALLSVNSILMDLPVPVILSGLRFLEYVPLALISAIVYKSAGDRPFLRVARVVFVFMVIETVIGVSETRFPNAYWGTTFIGTRSFGTFNSPDLFGPAMAVCFPFVMVLPQRWRSMAFLLILFDVFASGSRAAILGYFVILGTYFYFGLRNAWVRLVFITTGIFVSPLLLVLSTLPAFTGRGTGLGLSGYERLSVWANLLGKLNSASDLLLGWGVGLGSNTVFSLYGGDVAGNYISDNTFFFLIGSYGIFGVVLFSVALVLTGYQLRKDRLGISLVVFLTLQMMIGQTLESYPINVLAMIVVGWRLAACSFYASVMPQGPKFAQPVSAKALI